MMIAGAQIRFVLKPARLEYLLSFTREAVDGRCSLTFGVDARLNSVKALECFILFFSVTPLQ
jgi:hypothetical protein